MNKKYTELSGLLIAVSSLFFLRGIFFQGYYHPVILFTGVCGLLTFAQLTIRPKIRFLDLLIISLFFCAVTFVYVQYNILEFNYGILNELGRFGFPFLTAFVLLYNFKKKSEAEASLKYVTALLLIDTIYRLVINGPINFFDENRYLVKGGGLLFMDSNFPAIFAGAIVVFILSNKVGSRLCLFLNIIVILMSKSFAVWFVLVLVVPLMVPIKYIFTRSCFAIMVAASFAVMAFFANFNFGEYLNSFDGSLRTKVLIFSDAISILANQDTSLFLGVGLGNFIYYSQHGSHSLFGLGAELGVFGFVILLLPLFLALKKQSNRPIVVFLLLSGLSLYPLLYLGYFYYLMLQNLEEKIGSVKKSQ